MGELPRRRLAILGGGARNGVGSSSISSAGLGVGLGDGLGLGLIFNTPLTKLTLPSRV
jgi:hypothetical protein